ncbi:MAG: hypothetical protein Q9159_002699 [Coniocarpon cinnabarinum]
MKRNPALSKEEFDSWSETHGPLFMRNPVAPKLLVKYTQTHLDETGNQQFAAAGFTPPSDCDGVVNFWFRSLEDAHELLDSQYYREVVVPDEEKMMDRSKTRLVVCRDEDHFVGGEAGSS